MSHAAEEGAAVGALDDPRLLVPRPSSIPRFTGTTAPGVEEYRPGDIDDFDRLYRATHARILLTLTGFLRDRAAAEDCVQETFIRAFRAWPRWRPEARPEVWLYTIALNVAASHRRQEGRRTLRESLRVAAGLAVETDDIADTAPDGRLMAALRRLPRDQAAAVVLRHHHGYSNREIGVALGVSESTIGSRLAAGKQRLLAELGRGVSDPSDEDGALPGTARRSA